MMTNLRDPRDDDCIRRHPPLSNDDGEANGLEAPSPSQETGGQPLAEDEPELTITHQEAESAAKFIRQIGPYRLLQPLGAGGMGQVWIAEQHQPVKRQVALKLIKSGVGSKEIIARFEGERQALSLMNHPNIARILDAGTTADGQPYFAMELVRGQTLAKYCDQNRLSIDDRLRLFIDICDGVQHAHQKGIIHRDLKPANILVTVADGVAVPKVIDFGLAKAMESTQRLTDQSLFTGIGQILGTLKYMSPEQASLESIDIDTRTDIYALGVILYELLAGSTPLDEDTSKGAAVLKLLELIREREPVKPSSRLSHSRESSSAITDARRTDISSLNRILVGDLDWVVMKALEKDRTRRYESVSGFAADIQRYLNSEPVVARPPSLNYRVQKFVRKNRAGVIAASLLTLALVGGIAGTSLALFRALAAESLAERRLGEANTARAKEVEQRQFADQKRKEAEAAQDQAESATERERIARLSEERERKFAEAINQFVKDDFLALTSIEGQSRFDGEGLNRDTTIFELLERAAGKLRERTDLAPLIEAELSWIIGVNYRGAGEASKGLPFLERAVELRRQELGPEDPETLFSMHSLATGYVAASQLDKALPLHEETLALSKGQLGLSDSLTLASMSGLAGGYLAAGQLDKALPLFEETLELRKNHLGLDDYHTLISMANLANGYRAAGQLNKALPLFEETFALKKNILGSDHYLTLISMNNLANGYRSAGQLEKALPLCEEALSLTKSKLGPDHPNTLSSMNNLAEIYRAAGKLDKALPLCEEALSLRKDKLGPDHPSTLSSMNTMARVYRDSGQLDKALTLHEQALELRKSKLGPDHPATLGSMGDLAANYWSANRLDRSVPMFEQTLELSVKKLGRNHPDTQRTVGNLGVNYWYVGREAEGIPLLEEAYESSKRDPSLAFVKRWLRDAYLKGKLSEKFETFAAEELTEARTSFAEGSAELAKVLVALGKDYLTVGHTGRAREVLAEGVEIRQKVAPDAWDTFDSQSLLGAAYLGQATAESESNDANKTELLVKAEAFLTAGYEGLTRRADSIPKSVRTKTLAKARDRLIEVYTITENAAELENLKAAQDSSEKKADQNESKQ